MFSLQNRERLLRNQRILDFVNIIICLNYNI